MWIRIRHILLRSRTESGRNVAEAVSIEAVPLLEQHRRTGPPHSQTKIEIGDGLWLIPDCLEDATGNRDDAHDQQGASQVVGKG